VSQSAHVVRAVQLFSSQPPSWNEFLASGGWQGYDVVRWYTNVNTTDQSIIETDQLIR
jgi:hypothetical protein